MVSVTESKKQLFSLGIILEEAVNSWGTTEYKGAGVQFARIGLSIYRCCQQY